MKSLHQKPLPLNGGFVRRFEDHPVGIGPAGVVANEEAKGQRQFGLPIRSNNTRILPSYLANVTGV